MLNYVVPLNQSAYNEGRAFNFLLKQQDFGGGGGGGSITLNMDTLLISAARNSNVVVNQYLRTEDGTPMNQAPVLLGMDYKMYAISVTCVENSTCTFEIHNNGVLIPGAVVTLTNEKEKYFNCNIDIPSDCKLMIYNNGTSNKPKVSVFLKKPLI